MYEAPKKGMKDFLKKIGEKISNAEKDFHGNVGRGALNAADKLGSKLPKFLQPEDSVDPKDMARAMEAWKNHGTGKIGNDPNFGKGYRSPEYYNGDHMSKMADLNNKAKAKKNYVEKYEESPTRKFDVRDYMSNEPMNGKFVKAPPSKGEIAAGRAISIGYLGGGGAAAAHSYWTNKKNENK